MKILTESTDKALWARAFQEAQLEAQVILQEEVSSYLVLMLMRYIVFSQLTQQVIAINFLKSIQSSANIQKAALQNVGDQCLIITGFFPGMAEKKHISLRYYIDIGQMSYSMISQNKQDVFDVLSLRFAVSA